MIGLESCRLEGRGSPGARLTLNMKKSEVNCLHLLPVAVKAVIGSQRCALSNAGSGRGGGWERGGGGVWGGGGCLAQRWVVIGVILH